MTTPTDAAQGPSSRSGQFLPALLMLFVGSGCAALIYEVVWFQLLQLVIGSSGVSIGVLLGTYMGGMCLGSLLLPRIVSRRRHPLIVYGVIELAIGIIGILVLYLTPWIGMVYSGWVGHGFGAILLRGLLCAVCLLPPTLLMGATLPAMARWVETSPRGISWMGFFYGGNIAGAVFGCLLAGFYLLRVHDVTIATFAAAALNAAVGLGSILLARIAPYRHSATAAASGSDRFNAESKPDAPPAPHGWTAYGVIAISGLCALGAEVIWTRQLSLLLGGTVYTFAIILAVFLTGLGLGSSAGSFLAREFRRPRLALASCQLLLTGAIAWAAFMLARSLPFWPVNPSLSASPWISFQLDLVRCLWAILPPAVLWGASFPLALASVARPGQDPGRLLGGVYAANTIGAIVGALGFSVILIPTIGTQSCHRLLIALAALAALLALTPLLRFRRTVSADTAPLTEPALRPIGIAGVAGCMGIAVWLISSVAPVPAGLFAYGRYLPTYAGIGTVLYLGEGMNASVAVTETSWGARNFHVSGKVEASSEPQDMRLQRMLGHIPALVHPRPRSVLIVGCGAGVTAGSFVLHPDIERIVICEIEPLIPRVVARHFTDENHGVLNDPRVEVINDDGRHYILTTKEKFDIITSDPIHPWVKGSATLYTREYFDLVKRHLNPGGVVTQWVPLYESSEAVVKSEIATFFQVFQHGTIWNNDNEGKGYDVVLLGHPDEVRIHVDDLQARLDRPDHAGVLESLEEVGVRSAVHLLATYGGNSRDLAPWLADATINRDRNLRLQYMAGFALNTDQSDYIHRRIQEYRRYPDEHFTGSHRTHLDLRVGSDIEDH